jgi:predicted transcriptional regulator YdeE
MHVSLCLAPLKDTYKIETTALFDEMEPVIGQLEKVSLIGYVSKVDKSNAEEEETITSELIERLLGMWESVKGIQDDSIYMMWTWDNRLEGSAKEEMFIGFRVSDDSEAPGDMVKKTLSKGGYAVYSMNPAEIEPETWDLLYKQLFSKESGLEESAPFILQRHVSEEQVDIYIPVKEAEPKSE